MSRKSKKKSSKINVWEYLDNYNKDKKKNIKYS